jgi:hypothetical protein
MGSLTITSGDMSITILDRNLWATEMGTTCPDYNSGACGYYFQWWNNHWFGKILNNSDTWQVDTTDYSRANPYVSNVFISVGRDWSTTINDNLWWWYALTWEDYMRQWPCPEWYHVPTLQEFDILKLFAWNNWSFWSVLFYLPFAWRSSRDKTQALLKSHALLWSSTPNTNKIRDTRFQSGGIIETTAADLRSFGFSVRCVQNTPETQSQTSVLSFNTMGWQRIWWQTVPTNGTGHTPWYEPKREWYVFNWWYKDSGYNEIYSFQDDIITWDTTIYAKWWCNPWFVMDEDWNCIQHIRVNFVANPSTFPDGEFSWWETAKTLEYFFVPDW